MYYSFRCTYCGRLFYTYEMNKQRASQTLYGTVKQHLIDTGEDDKEYEMDDGATEDSNQIYAEMTVSDHVPTGGFEATHHTGLRPTSTTSTIVKKPAHTSINDKSTHTSSESHTNSSHKLTIFLLLIAVVLIAFIAFMLISLGTIQQVFL